MEPVLIALCLCCLLGYVTEKKRRRRKLKVLIQQHLNQVYANSSTRKFQDKNNNSLDNNRKLKDEISSNPNLLRFVKQNLWININNLNFFTTIEDFLRKAREADSLLLDAVVLFEEDHDSRAAALKKLLKFKEVGTPFTKKFIEEFELVEKRLEEISIALHQLKRNFDQKLLCVEEWRFALCVISATVSICATVVSVGLNVVHEIGWAFAASLVSKGMPLLKKGIDWKLHKVQSAREKQKEVFEKLENGTEFALHEFNCIKDLIKELETKIDSRIRAVESAIEKEEEAALKAVILEIKHNAKSVEYLENEIDRHAGELNMVITHLQILIY
ncbi:hypothetical protein J5N97_023330 [Dioscorea zingiberensis]|uniref:Uncharacterized protein n=1 Tax=Dioscorea zingiberensis TaxID=325984 RepID=A0A9D5CC42_9LILI|nr:hypothetical protein J5N97_023330 [Dioscorea zingiberensis]